MHINSEAGLFLTRRCPLQCAHCAVSSTPKMADPPEDAVKLAVQALVRSERIQRVCVTGGEPFLRIDLLRHAVQELSAAGKAVSVVTSGYWATDEERASGALENAFSDVPVTLWLSIDEHHGQFLGANHYQSAIVAAHELGLTVNVVSTYSQDRHEAEDYFLSVVPRANVRALVNRVKYQPVFRVGRGEALSNLPATAAGPPAGHCGNCTPHLNADGAVMACCSEFAAAAGNPLLLGHVGDAPLDALLDRGEKDWLIQAVRTLGPARLARMAERHLPDVVFAQDYLPHDICAVCVHVMRTPAAVQHLRRLFASDKSLRERVVLLRSVLYGESEAQANYT